MRLKQQNLLKTRGVLPLSARKRFSDVAHNVLYLVKAHRVGDGKFKFLPQMSNPTQFLKYHSLSLINLSSQFFTVTYLNEGVLMRFDWLRVSEILTPPSGGGGISLPGPIVKDSIIEILRYGLMGIL